MIDIRLGMTLSALIVAAIFLLAACGDGLSRAEVQEIVRAERPEAPVHPQPELTNSDVEEVIRKVIANISPPLSPHLLRSTP